MGPGICGCLASTAKQNLKLYVFESVETGLRVPVVGKKAYICTINVKAEYDLNFRCDVR